MNTELSFYDVNFINSGYIMLKKHFIQTESVLFNHKYSDLTEFLCCCAINDGEIPDTDEVYRQTQQTFKTSCLTEDNQYNDVAINMSNADTVGRRVALRSFYSLPDYCIKYLQREYNYFPDATDVFEDRLDQIGEEIYEVQNMLKYCPLSLKNKVENSYKNCLMYEDMSIYKLSKKKLITRIDDIEEEIDSLKVLKRQFQTDIDKEPKLNVYYDKLMGKLLACIDKMDYLQNEKCILKYNPDRYESEDDIKSRLDEIEEEIRYEQQELSFSETDMECCDGFNSNYYRFENVRNGSINALEDLKEEKSYLQSKLKQ